MNLPPPTKRRTGHGTPPALPGAASPPLPPLPPARPLSPREPPTTTFHLGGRAEAEKFPHVSSGT